MDDRRTKRALGASICRGHVEARQTHKQVFLMFPGALAQRARLAFRQFFGQQAVELAFEVSFFCANVCRREACQSYRVCQS